MSRIASTGVILAVLALVLLASVAPVLAAPQITLSPDSGAVGTRVTLTGLNFDSYRGDTLLVFFNATEIAGSPVTVSAGGNFTVLFDVPDDTAPGVARVSVLGPLGALLAEASFNVAETRINLSVRTGIVASSLAVTGSGFHAGGFVELFFSSGATRADLGTVIASGIGDFDFPVIVPPGPAGQQTITARDTQGHLAQTVFVVLPALALEPTSTAPGQDVTARGSGFAANSPVMLYFETSTVSTTLTGASGGFAGAFPIPLSTAGPHTVRANDTAGNAASADFATARSAVLDRTSGPVGADVVVSGNGYPAGAGITISYDGTEVARGQADGLGSFSSGLAIPVSAGGPHEVAVSDGAVALLLTFSVESTPPASTTLLTPAAGAQVSPPIVFLWKVVDDASRPVTYDLQVASDTGFANLLLEKLALASPTYSPTADEQLPSSRSRVPLYWRVRPVDAASNQGQWSPDGTFYMPPPGGLPIWAIGVLIGIGVLIMAFLVMRVVRQLSYR